MANHPDRFAIWPGYFDSKTSRRSGRRVAKAIAIRDPNLDGLAYAARGAGIGAPWRWPPPAAVLSSSACSTGPSALA